MLTVAAVGALITGGAIAYFSDTETSTGNVCQAGVIDLVMGTSGQLPIDLRDMKPCDWKYAEVTLTKTEDSNDGPAWLHIANVETGQGKSSEPEREAEAAGAVWNIDDWITFDLNIDSEVVIDPDDHMKLGLLECIWIPLGYVGDGIDLVLSFHLQAETPNEYQGDWCTFDLEFYMTDHNAPPPSGGIILENKDTSWNPILGDGKWGLCWYHTSDLTLAVYAQGLEANTYYQIGINSPEDATWYPVSGGETMRVAMASALAGGVYDGTNPTNVVPPSGFNLYERGYYTAGAAMLHGGAYVTGDTGSYNFTQSGNTGGALTNAKGVFYLTKACALPSGEYEYIKVLVKKDSDPWTTELMEKTTPMFFSIP